MPELALFVGPRAGSLLTAGVGSRRVRARWMCSSAGKNDQGGDRRALQVKVDSAPTSPGVYMFRDERGALLYIGKSKSLRTRVRSYLNLDDAASSSRIRTMVETARDLEFVVTPSESAALALEASMVKEHQPPFNVLLKDDKKSSYILVTHSEKYPRIVMTRTRRTKSVQDRVYGPFVDSNELKRTLQTIRRVFPLRQRPKPLFADRPCLNYEIGRCPGVCQDLVSSEEYRRTVSEAEMIFQGRLSEVYKIQEEKMWLASEQERFEDAANFRDNILQLESVGIAVENAFSAQNVTLTDATVSCDVVAGAAATGVANAQIFQVRSGKVVNRFMYTSQNVKESDDIGVVMQSAMQEHYRAVRHPSEIPELIITMGRIPDVSMLQKALSETRGKSVAISSRRRSGLVRLVEQNAEMEIKSRLNLQKDISDGLDNLSEMLRDIGSDFRTQNAADDAVVLHRIECYDISHTSGTNAVASRVVLVDGVPETRLYRKYYLRDPESSSLGNPNDYMSMQEVLRRRFARKAGDEKWPDLVVIDGGRGQLSAAVEVLEALGVDLVSDVRIVSLAKREEEVFVPGVARPINRDKSPGVRILMLARDEAHRFAISSHRNLRGRESLRSRIGSISGLGKEKQRGLLESFGNSPEKIAAATHEELACVPGIGPVLATRIRQCFDMES